MSDRPQTIKQELEQFRAWKESQGGQIRVSQAPLERVFMRQCPCCGSEVFFDREKDAVIVIDAAAGYIQIRLKNGETRTIDTLKIAEAALEGSD